MQLFPVQVKTNSLSQGVSSPHRLPLRGEVGSVCQQYVSNLAEAEVPESGPPGEEGPSVLGPKTAAVSDRV